MYLEVLILHLSGERLSIFQGRYFNPKSTYTMKHVIALPSQICSAVGSPQSTNGKAAFCINSRQYPALQRNQLYCRRAKTSSHYTELILEEVVA